jgi:shikimate kinase
VIAVGGSTPLDPENLFQLKRLGKLIYLTAPKSLIRKRQLTPPIPLYIDPNDPENSFEKMWSQRISKYERIKDYQVEIDQKSDLEILEELWQVINLETSFGSLLGESPTEKLSES